LKFPFISKEDGGNGVHDASSDPDQIRTWGRLCPNGNIGIACGAASGFIAVDIDPRNSGDWSLAALAAKGRVLPKGPRQRTGNKGWHHLFKADPRINGSKGKLGPGIEIKAGGGYIVVALSWTRKSADGPGGQYAWETSPHDVPIPRAPLWLTTMLIPPPEPKVAFVRDANGGDLEPLARFVATSPKGERNDRLYWAARRARELIAGCSVSEMKAERRLSEAAAVAGLPAMEALRTIRSGLRGQQQGCQS
jgi:hypothetical protein